jgi:hypothetical protein
MPLNSSVDRIAGAIPGTRYGWQYIAAIAGAIIFATLFSPVLITLIPPCPLRELTGLHCPGCGTLRSLAALAHGDFFAAFGKNQLLYIFIPVLLSLYFLRAKLTLPEIAAVIFSLIILYGILRNIPYFPLTLLAP